MKGMWACVTSEATAGAYNRQALLRAVAEGSLAAQIATNSKLEAMLMAKKAEFKQHLKCVETMHKNATKAAAGLARERLGKSAAAGKVAATRAAAGLARERQGKQAAADKAAALLERDLKVARLVSELRDALDNSDTQQEEIEQLVQRITEVQAELRVKDTEIEELQQQASEDQEALSTLQEQNLDLMGICGNTDKDLTAVKNKLQHSEQLCSQLEKELKVSVCLLQGLGCSGSFHARLLSFAVQQAVLLGVELAVWQCC
jgi:chromosome segregation ATPase